jgi:hypothetical protein
MVQLRAPLLKIVGLFLGLSCKQEDVQALLFCLEDCNDDMQLEDILATLLAAFWRIPHQLAQYIEHFGGVNSFFLLLDRQSENVRVLALKIIGQFLNNCSAKCLKHFQSDYSLSFIFGKLQQYPLTESSYMALLEVVTNNYSQEIGVRPATLLDQPQVFENPAVIGVIFKLLKPAPLELKQKVILVCEQRASQSQSQRESQCACTR